MREETASRLFAWVSVLAAVTGLLALREFLAAGRVDSVAFRQAFGAFAILALASGWLAFLSSPRARPARPAPTRLQVRIQPATR